jgi:DnaJ-class molecular chaperone
MTDDEQQRYAEMAPGDEAPPGTEGTGDDVCPACAGAGEKNGSPCEECGGAGTVVRGVSGG